MSEEEESIEKVEKTQIEGIIRKEKVVISNQEAIEEFYKNSYIGTLVKENDHVNDQEILVLDSLETLLLSERRRILLWEDNDKNKRQHDFESLLEYFTKFDDRLWHKYVIYMDLRKRGYIVRTGYGEGIEFRVYKRGADFINDSAKYLIYPVFEGEPIELKDLDKISRVAMSSRKDLIIATVDRLSKAIYYSVKKFQIMNKNIENLDPDLDNVG